jgi:hypothetical protein
MSPKILCKNLRTKSMFIPALVQQTAPELEEQVGHSSHCWCNCTMTETGPDDHPVGHQVCHPTRSCFEE